MKYVFGWFKALWKLDDETLRKICGTDYALYVVFLRLALKMLFLITIFNAIVIVPLYSSGDPIPSDDYKLQDMSVMNKATVLNITAN